MKIEITERQPVKVAYLRYTGPMGAPLERFWRATVAPWLADHGLVDCPRYGVTLDDPAHTPANRCRYDACVELPLGLTLPDAEETTIPGGTYAATAFKGTGAEIGPAWKVFHRQVIDDGLRIDDRRPFFEHYPRGAGFDARTGTFSCQLCLPLAN